MNKYDNSTIYKISCKDKQITDCYIGSTTNLQRRTWKHRSDCHFPGSRAYNREVYKKMRDHGGWENWEINPLAVVKCQNKKELLDLERKYYEAEKNASLNTHYPGRTKQEAQFRWRKNNPNYMAKYREDNANNIRKVNLAYYQKNKAAITVYNSEIVECDICGTKIRRNNLPRHRKTAKCKSIQKTSSDTPEPQQE